MNGYRLIYFQMAKIRNPYSPGAGAPPPELVERDVLLDAAEVLLARTLMKRPEKSMMLIGLRGVGKTVLLNEIRRMAEDRSYHICKIEAVEDKALGPLLAPKLREILYQLDRMANIGVKVKRGLRVLGSFLRSRRVTHNDLTFGRDLDVEQGTADSVDLEIDLPALFSAVGEAAGTQARSGPARGDTVCARRSCRERLCRSVQDAGRLRCPCQLMLHSLSSITWMKDVPWTVSTSLASLLTNAGKQRA